MFKVAIFARCPSAVAQLILGESKYSLTPKKLLQKVFQLILLGSSVLFNILKVYQNRSPRKMFFKDGAQDGR